MSILDSLLGQNRTDEDMNKLLAQIEAGSYRATPSDQIGTTTLSGNINNALDINKQKENIGLFNNLTNDQYRNLQNNLNLSNNKNNLLNNVEDDDKNDQVEKRTLFQKIGDKLSDPVYRTRLSAGFNRMTANPNPALQQRANDMIKQENAKKTVNKTVEFLRNNNQAKLAEVIEANPALAGEVLKTYLASEYQTDQKYMQKVVGGLNVDQQTGKQYFITFDPSAPDGSNMKRIYVDGSQLTDVEKANLNVSEAQLTSGLKQAQDQGKDYFEKYKNFENMFFNLDQLENIAVNAVENGTELQTGWVQSRLPSFSSETSNFRSIANQLGINVINSATFGALSEKELNLALQTGLDQNLKGQDLVEHIREKKRVTEILRGEMLRKANLMLSGITLGQYTTLESSRVNMNSGIKEIFVNKFNNDISKLSDQSLLERFNQETAVNQFGIRNNPDFAKFATKQNVTSGSSDEAKIKSMKRYLEQLPQTFTVEEMAEFLIGLNNLDITDKVEELQDQHALIEASVKDRLKTGLSL